MGNVTMQGVQKILHLDVQYPNFPTWEEILDFDVDGVQVQAIATHKWREDIVRIVEPFQVEGDDYRYSFRPPLIALGAAMIGRKNSLTARGLTVRDDCIRMATATYRAHSTYLRLKPEIDREQEAFSSVFREELEALFKEDIRTQAHFKAQRLELRRKLRSNEIDIKPYQVSLKGLQQQAALCHDNYYTLHRDIEYELKAIKEEFIYRALAVEKLKHNRPPEISWWD